MSYDESKLKQSLTITLLISVILSLLITLLLLVFRREVISLSTSNVEIISLATQYLDTVLVTLVLLSLTTVITNFLRIKDRYSFSSIISMLSTAINILLSFYLITQKELGIKGAAYGTMVSAICETTFFIVYIKIINTSFISLVIVKKDLIKMIFNQIFISCASSVLWSLGALFYYFILGRIGDDVLFSLSIITPLESLILSFSIGLSIASGIEIGQSIPKNTKKIVYQKAWLSLLCSFISTLTIILILFAFRNYFMNMFTHNNPSQSLGMFFDVMLLSSIIKSLSIQLMNGIIRAGGDSLFCLKIDFILQWLVIIPLLYLLVDSGIEAIYLYSLFLFEELIKFIICLFRFKSDRWRCNFVHAL